MSTLNKYEQFLNYLFTNYKTLYGEDTDINTIIDMNLLSANQFISWDLVSLHLDLPWNFNFLSTNPNITFAMMQATPQYPWNPGFYSQNPNITIDIVKENPQIQWDWNGLSENLGIRWPIISQNLDLPWNWDLLMRSLPPSSRSLFFIPKSGDKMVFLPGISLQFANGEILSCNNVTSNKITTNSVSINTANTYYPLEIHRKVENLSFTYGYLNQESQPSSTFNVGNRLVSIRTNGRIVSNVGINIDCDIRNIENIDTISSNFCADFINQTTPKRFNFINGDLNIIYGWIGQDLLKLGYNDFVTPITNSTISTFTDNDNFVSPAGIQYTISYNKIIPILSINQKTNMANINNLTDRIDILEGNGDIAALTNTVVTLESTVSNLESSISNLESTISTSQSTISSLQSTISGLQSTISGLQSTISGLQNTISGLTSRIVALEA